MRKRCALTWDQIRGYYVDLPTYQMVTGTWLPVTPNVIHADGIYPDVAPKTALALDPTVLCDVPDAYAPTDADPITAETIRKIYAGNPRFDHDDYQVPDHSAPD